MKPSKIRIIDSGAMSSIKHHSAALVISDTFMKMV